MNDSWTVTPVSPESAGVVAALFAARLTPNDLSRRIPDPFGDES